VSGVLIYFNYSDDILEKIFEFNLGLAEKEKQEEYLNWS
jgi:hypothetical protein